MILPSNYYCLMIIIIISNSLSIFCQNERTYRELIKEQIFFFNDRNVIIDHSDLPVVKDELSVTLKINIARRGSDKYTVFYKGIGIFYILLLIVYLKFFSYM